jgi:DNA-binding transcriptional LysR family regulator
VRFETVPLVEDELVALLPAAHRLAAQRSIRAADLQGEAFVRTSAGSGAQIDRFLAEAGAQPAAIYHFEQMSSMQGFVAQGHAIAIAARLAVPQEPPEGMVYRSLSPRQRRVTGLAVRSLQRLSPAAAGFVELAREMARKKRFG